MPWTQIYDPTGSPVLSTILAAAPLVVLLGTLGLLGWSAPRAAASGLVTALAVAIGVYGMPWKSAVAAATYGACFGLFPIGWIVIGAVFLYLLTVESGQFEIVKSSVVALSPDHRIQALLIAFCFGAFVEGAAGFGTPVAISGALLMGAGFPPLEAAGLTLIANTAPVAFGALGTPIVTLAKVTGLPEMQLSAMAGRQLPLFAFLIPAWLVVTMSGWKGLRGVWPAVLISGGTFAVVQFFVSNYLGPALTDVAGGLISMLVLALLLTVWRPRELWQYARSNDRDATLEQHRRHYSAQEIARAWAPWLILSLCVFLWGLPPVRTILDGGKQELGSALVRAAKLPVRNQRTKMEGAVLRPADKAGRQSHWRRRCSKTGRISIQLAQCHGNRDFRSGNPVRVLDGDEPTPIWSIVSADDLSTALVLDHHRLHVGDCLCHPVQRQ